MADEVVVDANWEEKKLIEAEEADFKKQLDVEDDDDIKDDDEDGDKDGDDDGNKEGKHRAEHLYGEHRAEHYGGHHGDSERYRRGNVTSNDAEMVHDEPLDAQHETRLQVRGNAPGVTGAGASADGITGTDRMSINGARLASSKVTAKESDTQGTHTMSSSSSSQRVNAGEMNSQRVNAGEMNSQREAKEAREGSHTSPKNLKKVDTFERLLDGHDEKDMRNDSASQLE
jgi:hypothetical protein